MIQNGRNRGEENEVLLKAFLLQQMSLGNAVHPFGIIKKLSFGPDYEVPDWSTKYDLFLSKRDYGSLKEILPKAPTGYKADLGINGQAFSVKYTNAAKTALVNHTARPGFKRVCEEVDVDIQLLDSMIEEYWNKRQAGIIMEDVSNSDSNSPFAPSQDYFERILKYFLFQGTGSKDSIYPADYILKFDDPLNPKSYQIIAPDEAVAEVWSSLVFSVRSKKGMPQNYSSKTHPEIEPWVGYMPGNPNPKGALHIRS